ncbi:uncharacterized protein [Haliotis asinina]|uniref:uncharacterized protein n=1 Tax=Haliotis asinina TaxID=109174 RepID=UPI0035326318
MKQILGIKKLRLCKDRKMGTDIHTSSEIMSGHLLLFQVVRQRTIRIPVFVKVYRSCFEHYAIVYKDQKYSNLSTYINLKNCIVMCNENCKTQLRVVPHNFDGTVIVFDTQDKATVSSWKCAFEDSDCSSSTTQCISPTLSPIITRSPILPTLEEAIEEE